MDINHLLCHPITKPDLTYQELVFPSPVSSFSSNSPSPTSSPRHHFVLPLPANFENVDFWKHNRSMSTQSNASSCTTNSSISSSSSSMKMSTITTAAATTTTKAAATTTEQQKYRRRVNSESDTKFIAYPNHQYQKPKPIKRARSNSASYIQTRTPWTPDEDDLLQKGYEQGLSWAMISCTFLPHRSRGCCWGRFKTLQSKNAIEVYQQRICQRPWKAHFKK